MPKPSQSDLYDHFNKTKSRKHDCVSGFWLKLATDQFIFLIFFYKSMIRKILEKTFKKFQVEMMVCDAR